MIAVAAPLSISVHFRDLHHAWHLLMAMPFDIFFLALSLSKEKVSK